MNGEGTDVAELKDLDQQIAAQRAHAIAAHQAWVAADAKLRDTMAQRDALAFRLRSNAATAPPRAADQAGTAAATPTAPAPVVAASTTAAAATETSTRTVQNILFILGGLLLGTAAIVFTAVAWTTFGIRGRATILGVVTLVALAAPVVALVRKLYATAETVAAIALLLVVLDGYALWSVNLFDVQAMSGARYSGVVLLVVAAAALGYRLLANLVGPAFVALLAIQPVLPLLVTPEPLTAAGWSLVWSGIAALNLGGAWLTRAKSDPGPRQMPAVPRTICQALSLVLYGLWLAVGATFALVAELRSETVTARAQAGGAIVAVATVFAASTVLSRSARLARSTGAVAMVALALAVGGVIAAAWPGHALLLSALVALAAAVAALAGQRILPESARPGPALGAALVASGVGLVVGVVAMMSAVATIDASGPLWKATLSVSGPHPPLATWQLPLAVVAVATALALCLPTAWRQGVAAAGAVLALVAVPGSFALVWWAPAVLSLAGATVAAAVLVLGPASIARPAGISSLVLALNAVATAGARPPLSAAVLGAVGLLSVGVAVIVAAGRDRPGRAHQTGADPSSPLVPRGSDSSAAFAATAVAVGLLAAPAAVGSALVAAEAPSWWAARAAVIAVGVLLLVLGWLRVSRWSELAQAGYRPILVNALVWPTVGAFTGDESVGIYAAVSLLLVAIAIAALASASAPVSPGPMLEALIPATVAGLALLVSVVVPVLAVTVWPYSWLASIWSGPPSGSGLMPDMASVPEVSALSGAWTDAVALAILAFASATLAYWRSRRPAAALAGLGVGGPTAILIGLVAAGAAWPSVPAATLLIGLTLLLAAALTRVSGWRAVVATVQAIVYIGAGLAGALGVEWATLVALGAVMVAAAVAGAIGVSRAWRVAGWLAATGAAVAAAAAAGFAADLPARNAAFGVLAVAVLALFLGGAVLRPARQVEADATEAAAHAGAVVAIIFTFGWSGRTALVCLLWGIAVGLRALLPQTSRSGRATLAAVAAGFEMLAWWLLLTSRGVTLVEAYTVPLALVALLAGLAALRSRPDLRSWVAYGPALVAGFVPSLAVVLGAQGAPVRRLALGAAALIVVVLGSVGHRKAPVVVGGVVLALVALHELVLLWQRLPGWIPLAVGGLILLGLAITYERRLRDLRRVRTAVSRMT